MTGRPVVLVDLDDTCVPDRSAMRSALAATLRSVAAADDDAALDAVLAAARIGWRSGPYRDYCLGVGISSWEGLWLGEPSPGWPDGFEPWLRAYQRGAWPSHGGDGTALAARFRAERSAACLAFPGVERALDALRSEHELWLITNGDSRLQRAKLGLAGLDAHFDRTFVSGDIGAGKPADRFFDWVEEAARATDRSIVAAVGDSIEKDIRPALARGWVAVAVRADGALPDDLPAMLVSSFAEVPDALDRAGRDPSPIGRPPTELCQSGAMVFSVHVEVSLRPGIADPQGSTIERSLPTLGFDGVQGVRVGKSIRFSIEAADEAAARAEVDDLCHRFLTNPVIEDSTITIEAGDLAVVR